MGVRQPHGAEHQEDGNGNGNGRHHPCRQDEEQQVVLQGDAVAGEGIGRQRSQENRQERRPKADDHGVEEALAVARRTHDGHAALMDDVFVPGLRRIGLEERLGLPRAGGEKIDVAFKGWLEQHFGGVRDGVVLGLEPGGDDPQQRHDRYQRVADDQGAGDPFLRGRGLGDRKTAHRSFTLLSAFT